MKFHLFLFKIAQNLFYIKKKPFKLEITNHISRKLLNVAFYFLRAADESDYFAR